MDRFRLSGLFDKKTTMTWAEVIEKPDLESRLGSSEPDLGSFVDSNVDRLVATATAVVPEDVAAKNVDAATTYPRNATHLLGVAARYSPELAPLVVFKTMHALKTKTLHHVAAQNIHSIITQVLAHEHAATLTAAAEAAEDAEVFHCLLRHIGMHGIIADMMVALLGGETSEPELATRALALWREHGLAMHVAKYATVALSHPAASNYFSFLAKCLGQALNEPVGQFVDELLHHYDGEADDLSVIVFGAAEAAALNGVEFVHLAEGLQTVATIVTTLERGVFGEGPRDEADYEQSVSANATMDAILKGLPKVVRLFLTDALCTSFARARGSFGALRLRLLEVFMAVHRIGRKGTDEALGACDFYNVLFDIAEQFPGHDVLLNCVSEVCCDAATRTCDQKFLVRYLVKEAQLPQRIMRWKREARAPSLAAVACQVARVLGPALTPEEERELIGNTDEWNAFLDLNFVDTKAWYSTISGDSYAEVGSGKFPPVTHRAAVVLNKATSPSTLYMHDRGFPAANDADTSASARSSRYSYAAGDDDDDAPGEEPDTGFNAAWLNEERAGLPTEELDEDEVEIPDDGIPPPPPPPAAPDDDIDVDAVLGDEWIERTIEDLEVATSPQTKAAARPSDANEHVVEEVSPVQHRQPPPPADDDDDEDW